jgi:hypothetical protein
MTGPAVVVGSGRCVWDDLRALRGRTLTSFAVNDMVVYAPDVQHAVSHHQVKLPHWVALRTRRPDRKGRERNLTVHASAPGPGIDRAWPQFRAGGSSTLLAVRIALALGHEAVFVAGVPLDAGGYVWADPEETTAYDFARYRKAWEDARADLVARGVRGVSGYLRVLLGGPA